MEIQEKDIDQRLVRVEERTKSNSHRLDDVQKRLTDNQKMVQNISLIAQRQDAMETDVKQIKSDVKSLASKPIKRYDSIVQIVLSTIIAGLIGYILIRIGLGQ